MTGAFFLILEGLTFVYLYGLTNRNAKRVRPLDNP